MKLKEQGWYLEAIRSFKTVAGDSAYHRNAWFQVGQCYLALGRHSSAIEAFKVALGESPKQPQESAGIYHAIGQVLKSLGRHEEANRYAEMTWLTDPSFVPGAGPNFHLLPSSNAVVSQAPKRSWFARIFHFW